MTKFISIDKDTQEKKETVFTHSIQSTLKDIIEVNIKATEYKNVMHLGYDNIYKDVFKAWDNNPNNFTLFFGTKGNEFN